MNEPKFDNPNLVSRSPETKENLNFEVRKIPERNGFIYEIYFKTEEDAVKAVEDFWGIVSPSTKRGLESGMLKAFRDDITGGPRTAPRKLNPSSSLGKQYPDKPFCISFNGNTGALQPRGEAALRKLGYIE